MRYSIITRIKYEYIDIINKNFEFHESTYLILIFIAPAVIHLTLHKFQCSTLEALAQNNHLYYFHPKPKFIRIIIIVLALRK